MRIDSITAEMFRDIVRKNRPTVIIPLGATESHGPHLPLGTDTFQPEYVASAVSEKLGEKVLIAPTLPYGQHSTAKNVPGTMDITFDTLRSVVRDLLNSLIRHNVDKIMIISGHAGTSHMTAITEACRETAERNPDVSITFFSDFYIAADCEIMAGRKGDSHAGFSETSRMLHIAPSLVKEERPSGRYESFGYRVMGDAGLCMPSGVVGETEDASADAGKKINDFIVDEIVRMIG